MKIIFKCIILIVLLNITLSIVFKGYSIRKTPGATSGYGMTMKDITLEEEKGNKDLIFKVNDTRDYVTNMSKIDLKFNENKIDLKVFKDGYGEVVDAFQETSMNVFNHAKEELLKLADGRNWIVFKKDNDYVSIVRTEVRLGYFDYDIVGTKSTTTTSGAFYLSVKSGDIEIGDRNKTLASGVKRIEISRENDQISLAVYTAAAGEHDPVMTAKHAENDKRSLYDSMRSILSDFLKFMNIRFTTESTASDGKFVLKLNSRRKFK
jgi:hypothetical protein